jgi:DNA-binding response OmpR family regulator
MPKVLIVEDVKPIAHMLKALLEKQAYEVVCSYDGLDAWNSVEQSDDIDIIILDRILPDLDGLSFLKKLKSSTTHADIPVIMQTSMGETKNIIEGMEAGALYYLTKPVNERLLLSVLKSALEQEQYKKQLQTDNHYIEGIFRFINDARFYVRTLNEAKELAQGLAKMFPAPKRVIVGLTELLVNAVEHGNLNISYEEKSKLVIKGTWLNEVEHRLSLAEFKDKNVRVILHRTSHKISIKITDEGEGFDWARYLEFSPERAFDPNGRGIAMSKKASFDTLNYEGNGNTVKVTVNLK